MKHRNDIDYLVDLTIALISAVLLGNIAVRIANAFLL